MLFRSLGLNYWYCYSVRLTQVPPYRPLNRVNLQITIASELSAAATLVGYWTDLTPAVTITVGLFAIVSLNMCSVRWFGESEVLTASIKVVTFLGESSSQTDSADRDCTLN